MFRKPGVVVLFRTGSENFPYSWLLLNLLLHMNHTTCFRECTSHILNTIIKSHCLLKGTFHWFVMCIPVLISYHLFLYTIQVSTVRISHFLIPVGYGYLTVYLFSIPFGSIYHARVFIPRQNHPSIYMTWNGIDPNNNSCIWRHSHVDVPTKYQYLTGVTILTSTGKLFDTIIDTVHSYKYQTNNGVYHGRPRRSENLI